MKAILFALILLLILAWPVLAQSDHWQFRCGCFPVCRYYDADDVRQWALWGQTFDDTQLSRYVEYGAYPNVTACWTLIPPEW